MVIPATKSTDAHFEEVKQEVSATQKEGNRASMVLFFLLVWPFRLGVEGRGGVRGSFVLGRYRVL